jgi:Phosphotransferase enzyme family
MIDYAQLNHYIGPEIGGVSEPWKRVLGRLGDYTLLVVRALNLRPTAAQIIEQTSQHILVRITTGGSYVVLRIAPEADLSAALYFGRAMAGSSLPAARIIQHDLSKRMVPFAYLLEHYVCGVSAAQIVEPHILRAAARQAGRTLRRMQRVSAPGWGSPGPLGRWPGQSGGWQGVLRQLHASLAAPPSDGLVFSAAQCKAIAALPSDPRLACERPTLMHGRFGPHAVRCTPGTAVQIEALVDAGPWVGGDGLFDLACGLDPSYPAAWREGLLEGYSSFGPLMAHEEQRLALLRLLACAWSACQRYSRAEPHELARDGALALLESSRLLVPAAV